MKCLYSIVYIAGCIKDLAITGFNCLHNQYVLCFTKHVNNFAKSKFPFFQNAILTTVAS